MLSQAVRQTLSDMLRSHGALFAAPSAGLQPYVSGYHAYAAGGSLGAPATDWFFPGWANVRFSVGAGPWLVQFGDGDIFRVPTESLFGPSSRAIRSVATGGILFGAGLTPLGYASLLQGSAQTVADRVEALETEWPDAARLRQRLERAGSIEEVKDLFDRELGRRLRPPRPEAEAQIQALHGLLVNDHGTSIDETAHRLGLSPRTLNRLSTRTFGFSPKLLLRRSRFLKSLMAALRAPERPLGEVIDAAYFDQSHFVRDARDFLSMPPQKFLELITPLMRQSMANRTSVLGGPVQALHALKPAS